MTTCFTCGDVLCRANSALNCIYACFNFVDRAKVCASIQLIQWLIKKSAAADAVWMSELSAVFLAQ